MVIYLLFIFDVEELSDFHMSNITFFYVSVEENESHIALQIKFCLFKVSFLLFRIRHKNIKLKRSTKILVKNSRTSDCFP